MKKFLSVLLAVLMCVLPLTANVAAAELAAAPTATYTFSDVEKDAGTDDYIDVVVSFDAESKYNSIAVSAFEYDETVLEFVEFVAEPALDPDQDGAAMMYTLDSDKMAVTIGFMKPTSYTGVLFTIRFKVIDKAFVGKTNVTADVLTKNSSTEFDSTAVPATVKLKGQDFTGLSFNDKTVPYNSMVQTIEVAGVPANADVAYTLESDGSEFTGTDKAGEYKVCAVVTADGYNPETLYATLNITKVSATVSLDVADKVYDGNTDVLGYDKEISVEGIIDGDDVTATVESIAFPSADAGIYDITPEVKVDGADAGNYDINYNYTGASITARKITVSADNKESKIGKPLKTLTATIGGLGLADGDEESDVFELSTAATNEFDGVYDIVVTVKPNMNYSVDKTDGVYTVILKDTQAVNVTGMVNNAQYGDPSFTVSAVSGTFPEKVATYTSTNEDVVTVDKNTGVVTIVGVGSAEIVPFIEGDSEYADYDLPQTITVTERDLEIKVDELASIYVGQTAPALTYTVVGGSFANNDEALFSLKYNAAPEEVGTYTVVYDFPVEVESNYNFTFTGTTLEVMPKLVPEYNVENIPTAPKYGDANFVVTATPVKNEVTANKTVFASSDETVVKIVDEYTGEYQVVGAGTATITVSHKGDETTEDYSKPFNITVAPAELTVSAKTTHQARVNTTLPDYKFDFDVIGLKNGDTKESVFTGELATTADITAVNQKFPVTQGTLAVASKNYVLVQFNPGQIEIIDKWPQEVTVTPDPVPGDLVYGGNGFTITAISAELPASVATFAVDEAGKAVVDVDAAGVVTIKGAGTATITVTVPGDGVDYKDKVIPLTVVVAKAPLEIAVEAAEIYVGQTAAPTYTVVSGAFVGADESSFALKVNGDASVAGEYAIGYEFADLAKNYELVFNSANKTQKVLPKVDQAITIVLPAAVTYGNADAKLYELGSYNDTATISVEFGDGAVAQFANGDVKFLKAGTTTVTVKNDGNYKYKPFEKTVDLTVNKKTVKVQAPNLRKKVGTNDPAELLVPIYNPNDLVNGDVLTGSLAKADTQETVGAVIAINQGTVAINDNYIIDFVPGTLTITEKDIQTVTVNAPSLTYGDKGASITATSGEVANAEVEYKSSDESVVKVNSATGEIEVIGAGKATITMVVKGGENYEDETVTQEIEVAKKTVTVDTTTINLDAEKAEDKIKISGLETGDETVVIDTNKVQISDVTDVDGTNATVTIDNFVITGEGAQNYDIVPSAPVNNVPVKHENIASVAATVAANGAVTGSGTYLKGSKVALVATADSGYAFAGWYETASGALVSSSATYEVVLDSDKSLEARFAVQSTGPVGGGGGGGIPSRVVTFKISDKVSEKVVVVKGQKVEAIDEPKLEGFVFGGWFTDKECTKEYDFKTAVNANITLYAKWTAVEDNTEDGKGDEGTVDSWNNPYEDVSTDDWFYEYVKNATVAGLMNGLSETKFAPYFEVTRAMLVTILYRLEGAPEVDGDVTFKDVDLESYYGDALVWATENKLVNGFDADTFAPDVVITREQLATIMHRYAGMKEYDVSVGEDTNILSYSDIADVSDYAVEALQYTAGAGIMSGRSESTIDAKSTATRAEAATIIARFVEYHK